MERPLFWSAVALVGVAVVGALIVLGHSSLASPALTRRTYRRYFSDSRRERLFLSSVAFFVTFAVARVVTYAIRLGLGPFRDVSAGSLHVHHLVWGILLLLIVGYLWLTEIGTGSRGRRAASRLTAILYGVAAALTLDEFALWLRLEDVYWTREGRRSVEAVMLFGGVLAASVLGGGFFRALVRDTVKIVARLARRSRRTSLER